MAKLFLKRNVKRGKFARAVSMWYKFRAIKPMRKAFDYMRSRAENTRRAQYLADIRDAYRARTVSKSVRARRGY
jgi:hypothetical protein